MSQEFEFNPEVLKLGNEIINKAGLEKRVTPMPVDTGWPYEEYKDTNIFYGIDDSNKKGIRFELQKDGSCNIKFKSPLPNKAPYGLHDDLKKISEERGFNYTPDLPRTFYTQRKISDKDIDETAKTISQIVGLLDSYKE
jgi:hypothetical protein